MTYVKSVTKRVTETTTVQEIVGYDENGAAITEPREIVAQHIVTEDVDMTPDEAESRETEELIAENLRANHGFSNRQEALLDYRWRKEVNGIVVDGIEVRTDDRSKLLINGMGTLAKSEPPENERVFIAANGDLLSITNAQAIKIAMAVGLHVQNCITAFDNVIPFINEAETLTELFHMLDAEYDNIKGADTQSRYYISFDENGLYQEGV